VTFSPVFPKALRSMVRVLLFTVRNQNRLCFILQR
jgi:hypothetical protein